MPSVQGNLQYRITNIINDMEVHPWGTPFNPVGAVYMVIRKDFSFSDPKVIYVGQTGNLKERFDDHHKLDCFAHYGRTHIAVHQESSEATRLALESKLVELLSPPCNG